MTNTKRSDRTGRLAPGPLPHPGAYSLKRLILGPALPTAQLIHERLGKSTALAIFSSDALSSVAYATEEMLRTLFIAGAVATAAFALILPLSFVIVGVLAILMFSYRQTIKAYPSAGGAYIVTKDNFGLVPAQVAGVALLTDYVLTVAVSVSAGVSAIIAAVPALHELRVPLCLFFIALIAVGNLRGVKESGRIFAAPTFLFLTMIGSLILLGIVKLASGTLQHAATGGFTAGWASEHSAQGIEPLALVGLFLGLHALASGSTAMTGVEAISNGVPAFRPPEWKNARTTLMWMGALLGTMFLGISFLAQKVQAVPDPTQQQTVLAEIGRAVYGSSTFGHVAFYVLQIATTMVLVLAANTAFADFPRLASFQAGDDFLPRQFTTRGHRLVFSNGIIALSMAAAALVIAFGGDVTKLIPFYAIGVFTSFTLSQAGMAKRHLRIKEPHWQVGLLVNGLGALATGVVLIVIGITKFTHGAWAVIVLVPIMVYALIRLARQYEVEQGELQRDLERFNTDDLKRPAIVLLVDHVDSKTIHALQYAKTIRADDVRAVHIEDDPLRTLQLETAWSAAGLSDVPLKILRGGGEGASRLAGFIAAMPEDRDVNVLIPVPHETSARERISEARAGARLTRALLPYEQVRVTLVRDHPDGVHPLSYDEQGRPVVRMAPRGQHTAIVLVDKLDSAVLRAVRYPLTLGCTEVWAVHAAVDPDRAGMLVKKWMDARMPVPLDVIECWDRNITRALEEYVLSRSDRGTEVTVVMARRDFPKLSQRLLHDRTGSKIMRTLGRYPHIDVARVPYFFAPRPVADTSVAAPAGVQ
ncbi:MAG: APC family permease [Actinomycetota bacterium]